MRRPVPVAVGLLLLHAALLAWSGYRHSPTIDEPAHLAAGISNWRFGRMDLYSVNPPLVRMVAALPMFFVEPQTNWNSFRLGSQSRAEFQVGDAFADANGPRIFWLITLARWTCIPFSLLGGWICFQWARKLFGDASGLLALTLWCFSPTILGNGALITADVPAAALCVTCTYFLWRWLRTPSWSSAFLTGVSLGFAMLTKSSLVLCCGLLPVLWIVWHVLQCGAVRGTAGKADVTVLQQVAHLTLQICLAILILNLGYGFEGTGTSLGDYSFRSRLLRGGSSDGDIDQTGNRFADSWTGRLPLPFPKNYVIGIDAQKLDFENGLRSYLLGEIRTGGDGWWWFYLYAAAVKVPLGTWILALIAMPVAIRSGTTDQLLLVAPVVFFTALVSSQVGLNFFRYLLPAFPFAFIWISQAVCIRTSQSSRFLLATCVGALAWSVFSSCWYFPHSLAYFNELVGSPKNGYRIMVDANLDWGQDLIYLREWMEEHPSAAGLELRYYGPVAPVLAGLDVIDETSRRGRRSVSASTSAARLREPTWLAISVTRLAHQVAFLRDKEQQHDKTTWLEYL
ncbi:MAG: glycosyltransferase family 39 protein [Fuerstiella sp.]